MGLSAFLYRRLARWITCELGIPGCGTIALRSKYEVASASDVFCHPFYWQLFQWIDRPPALIVDCGAHCGHFSVLAEACCRARFGSCTAEHLLIEPNPGLLPVCRRNVNSAGFGNRVQVIQALLGSETGTTQLWVNSHNYLTSSGSPTPGSVPRTVPARRLGDIVGTRCVDLLKLDVEGAEYRIVPQELELLSRARLICMELHDAAPIEQKRVLDALESTGHELLIPPVASSGHRLMLWGNVSTVRPGIGACPAQVYSGAAGPR